jgi:hypothetical protein
MSHLSDIELVDFVEQALRGPGAAHAVNCDHCRARAEALRQTLARVADAGVPEPSPMFWEQLPRRVRSVIGDESAAHSAPAHGWFDWFPHLGVRAIPVAVAIVLVIVIGLALNTGAPTTGDVSPAAPGASAGARPVEDISAAEPTDGSADRAWAVVRALADDLAWDEALDAGLAARPDAAERAARTLTSDERSELLRLLEAETKGKGA